MKLSKSDDLREEFLKILEENKKLSPQPTKQFNEKEFQLEKTNSLHFKIVIIGDGAVGKTSLRNRYLGKAFKFSYQMTIGSEITIYDLELDNKIIRFQIWDLAGQPRFKDVRKAYYKHANAGLVVFDITKFESYKNTRSWIKELWTHNGRGPLPFLYIGNKIDLRSKLIKSIDFEPVSRNVKSLDSQNRRLHGFGTEYIETSAKTGENVELAFNKLIVHILSHRSYLQKKKLF